MSKVLIIVLLALLGIAADPVTQFSDGSSVSFDIPQGGGSGSASIEILSGLQVVSAEVTIETASVSSELFPPADLVIVTDLSGSMGDYCDAGEDSTGACITRMAAAKTAAHAFVDQNDFSQVQVGLSSYKSCVMPISTYLHPLTSNADDLHTVIDSYAPGGSTNMAGGMELAIHELLSERATGERKFMVLLTDGLANKYYDPLVYSSNPTCLPPGLSEHVTNGFDYSRDMAQLAADNDIVIFTVALGSGANDQIMEEIAETTGGLKFEAVTQDELVEIYSTIQSIVSTSTPQPRFEVGDGFWESSNAEVSTKQWVDSVCVDATCTNFASALQGAVDACVTPSCTITLDLSSPYAGTVILSDLRIELNAPPVLVPRCGDNVRDPGEQCDGDDLGGAICTDLGFVEGTLTCNNQCEFDTSQCDDTPDPDCGNGILEAGEQCEPDLPSPTCETLGYEGGTTSCDEFCMLDTSECNEPPTNDGRCVIDAIQCGETTAGFLLDDPSNPLVFDPDDPVDSLTWVLSDRDSNNGQFSINTPLPAPGVANRRFIATLVSSIYLPFSERFTFTVSDPSGASVEACYELSYAACPLRDIDIDDRTVDFGFDQQSNGGLQYDLTEMIVTPPAELACPEADIIWTVSNPASMNIVPPVNGIVTLTPPSWVDDATAVIDVTATCPTGESDDADLTVNYNADDAPADQISCQSVPSLVLNPSATLTVADLFNVPSSLGGIAAVVTSEPSTVTVQDGLPDLMLTSNGLQGSTVVSVRITALAGRQSEWCDVLVLGASSSCSASACDSCFALGVGARGCLASNDCFDRAMPIVVRNPTEFSPAVLTTLADSGQVALSTTDGRFTVDPTAGSGNDVYELNANANDGERAALRMDVTPQNFANSIRYCYDLVRSDIPGVQDPDSDLVSGSSDTFSNPDAGDVSGRGPFIFTARVWLRK